RLGPVLAVKTQEGSREQFHGRASLAATGLSATLDGPIGAARKTSWLFSARKSYLDYVLARLDEGGIVLGFYDTTARLSHHPSPGHSLSLGWLHGRSQWRSTEPDLGPQDSHTADAGTDLLTAQWRWLPSPRSWLESTLFFSRETGLNQTFDGADEFRSASRQWGWRASATRVLGSHRLEAGVLLRGLDEDSRTLAFDRRSGVYQPTESYDARSAEHGGYAQDTWT